MNRIDELLKVVYDAQAILAEYSVPDNKISDHDCINRLLGVLDSKTTLAIQKDLREFAAGETVPKSDWEKLSNAAEMLWAVVANVSVGDWTKQSVEWQEAAARWRDNYFEVITRAATRAEPDYEALEREHFGDSDKKTGIYAEPLIGVDEGKPGGDMSATVTGKFKDGVLQVEKVEYAEPTNANSTIAIQKDLREFAAGETERESADPICKEADGCPTEITVLKRFWRERHTATNSSPRAEPDYKSQEREHFGDSDKKTGIYAEPANVNCHCLQCVRDRGDRVGIPAEMTFMITCDKCGDKRCPRASDHRNHCHKAEPTNAATELPPVPVLIREKYWRPSDGYVHYMQTLLNLRQIHTAAVAAIAARDAEIARLRETIDFAMNWKGAIGVEEFPDGSPSRYYLSYRGEEYSGATWLEAIDAAMQSPRRATGRVEGGW